MKRYDYYLIWRTFRKWFNKLINRDNEDDYFDHPFVIF